MVKKEYDFKIKISFPNTYQVVNIQLHICKVHFIFLFKMNKEENIGPHVVILFNMCLKTLKYIRLLCHKFLEDDSIKSK